MEEQLLRVLHDKINMFELVVGEMDAILGTLDDARDFAEIVMDLWIAGRESGEVERRSRNWRRRLLEAKKQHVKVQELDEVALRAGLRGVGDGRSSIGPGIC